ncbi:hypothetical protein CR513_60733, partial [Mucuna pruriens]
MTSSTLDHTSPKYLNPPQPNIDTLQRRSNARVITPIPMPYAELLPYSIHNLLIVIVPLKPIQPPYPKSYDPNAKCEYHVGAIRHPTKKCWSFHERIMLVCNISSWYTIYQHCGTQKKGIWDIYVQRQDNLGISKAKIETSTSPYDSN